MAQPKPLGVRGGAVSLTVPACDGAATVDGTPGLPARDSTAARLSAEATHVDGALAAHAVRYTTSVLRIAAPLASNDAGQFAVSMPELTATLAGTAAATMIQMLDPDDNGASLDSVGAGVTAAPSPRGFLDPAWLAARAAAQATLEATPAVIWTEPVSVAGADVLMIGQATLVLSNWPGTI